MNKRVFNFYPGPTALPRTVLNQIERDLFNFRGTGMSVMEISHRAPEIEFLLADTAERARRASAWAATWKFSCSRAAGRCSSA